MHVLYQQTPNPEDLKKKDSKKHSGPKTRPGVAFARDQAIPDVERLKKIEEGKKQNTPKSKDQKK